MSDKTWGQWLAEAEARDAEFFRQRALLIEEMGRHLPTSAEFRVLPVAPREPSDDISEADQAVLDRVRALYAPPQINSGLPQGFDHFDEVARFIKRRKDTR